jgi:hypothetical protein
MLPAGNLAPEGSVAKITGKEGNQSTIFVFSFLNFSRF